MSRKRYPAIPSVPVNEGAATKRFLQSLKELVEIVTGQRGDRMDRAVTWRELQGNGFTVSNGASSLGIGSIGGTWTGGGGGVDNSPFADLTVPPAPINVSVSANTTTNYITWTNPGLDYISYAEIYRSPLLAAGAPAPALGTAELIGTGEPIGIYADKVEPLSRYYYWVRFVSYAGVQGPWHDLSGIEAVSPTDPGTYLTALETKIGAIHLDAGLSQEQTLKLENGYITGYGLITEGTSSTALWRVDRFAVGSPGSSSLSFVVDGNNVVMDGAFIKTATITDAHINNLSVDKLVGNTAAFVDANITNLNASKITGDTATFVNSNITYLDVAKLTGDKASFVNANISSVDVGVITGNTANFVNANLQSASVAGVLTGSTVIGATVKTGSGNQRVEMRSSDNSLKFYDSGGTARVSIDNAGAANANGFVYIDGRAGDYGIVVEGSASGAVYGYGTGYGVRGNTSGGYGVHGTSSTNRGVWGQSTSSDGVFGSSTNGVGVKGQSGSSNAFWAQSNNSAAVAFFKNQGSGTAVHADSTSGYGVNAYSSASGLAAVYGVGVGGTTGVAGASVGRAVQGISSGTGSNGVGGYFVGGNFDANLAGTGQIISFTGTHEALLSNGSIQPEVGDILVSTGVADKVSVSTTIHYVEPCSTANSKLAFGVCSGIYDLDPYDPNDPHQPIAIPGLRNKTEAEYDTIRAQYRAVGCNGIGEGQMNVCSANGNISRGDFISTSAVIGKGQKWDGVSVETIVGKAWEDVDWSQEPGTTKMIAVTYNCS